MPFNNPPTGGTFVFPESRHSLLYISVKSNQSLAFVHQNTMSLKCELEEKILEKQNKTKQKTLFTDFATTKLVS